LLLTQPVGDLTEQAEQAEQTSVTSRAFCLSGLSGTAPGASCPPADAELS
jgi:hypothetical protein